MENTIRTSRTARYLEMIFQALNQRFFDGALEEPILTIQTTPRMSSYITPEREWQTGDGERRELNISADVLDSPIEKLVTEVMHECIHLWNLQNGVKDCSRGGTYHNKTFKNTAEAHGLDVEHDMKTGWSRMEPQEVLCRFIREQGWGNIEMNRGGSGKEIKLRPSSTRKYVCPQCGNSVRATKEVNIGCLDCNVTMVLEGGNEAEV